MDIDSPVRGQTEKFHIDDPAIDKSIHGYEGDFHVSRGTFTAKAFQDAFIDAAASLGIPEVPDANDLSTAHAACVSTQPSHLHYPQHLPLD